MAMSEEAQRNLLLALSSLLFLILATGAEGTGGSASTTPTVILSP